MALPEKLVGGRTIVIEAIPPGTGIGDLIGAFSPFGAIRYASVGPPAVVSFESEAAASHALLVASMKSVSLLGGSREMHPSGGVCPSPTPTRPCSNGPAPLNLNSPTATAPHVQVPVAPPASQSLTIEAGTAPPTDAAVPERDTTPDDASAAALRTATRLSEARRTMDWIAENMILECMVLEGHVDVIKQIQDQLAEHLRGLNIHAAKVQVSATAETPWRKKVTIEYRTGVKSCSRS